ncbi:hypothetical protein [Streptomyces sp. NWU339]|nr:hypothetical protein [Streptomyces sp. NWU339]
MSVAQHIAVIDELCFRPFPAEHGPSDGDFAGPCGSPRPNCRW